MSQNSVDSAAFGSYVMYLEVFLFLYSGEHRRVLAMGFLAPALSVSAVSLHFHR